MITDETRRYVAVLKVENKFSMVNILLFSEETPVQQVVSSSLSMDANDVCLDITFDLYFINSTKTNYIIIYYNYVDEPSNGQNKCQGV